MSRALLVALVGALVSTGCATPYVEPEGSSATLEISAAETRLGNLLTGEPARSAYFWVQLFDYRDKCPSFWTLGSVSSNYLGNARVSHEERSTTVKIPARGHFFYRAYWQASYFGVINSCEVSGGFVPEEGGVYSLELTAVGSRCSSYVRSEAHTGPVPQFNLRSCKPRE
ncbi:MAG: hypothetical protein MJE66_09335 [Proteobacteria bacterium]|nr:hypothetical protein [Pseudomonadota bacterium]